MARVSLAILTTTRPEPQAEEPAMEKMTYVGLDVHKDTIAIAKLRPRSDVPLVWQIPNETKAIRRTFGKLLAEVEELRCCYEAGPCGFEVQRQLEAMGIECVVVAPSLIPRRPGERIKTDRRDAVKLARLDRARELTAIHVPSSKDEAVRDLVRAREDVRKDLVAARNRMSKFLLRHGRVFREGRHWTVRHRKWLLSQAFEHAAEKATFDHYLASVDYQDASRMHLEKEIAAVAAQPEYAETVAKLSSLRGIAVLSAMVLITEIQDFRRFGRPRELMAYLGLVPSEHSSGATERRGGITKTGNSHARRILVEAAWHYRHPPVARNRVHHSMRGEPAGRIAFARKAQARLHKRYVRMLSRGKSRQLAAVAVARELCGFVWAAALQA
jgi:transposase